MPNPKLIELLAPAKDLECGIAAIDHGADAVYIGAERFGARQAAANATDHIAALCDYAHRFRAKVYVTVNTIIFDDEVEATQRLLRQLAEVGVDAILVQDMAVLELLRQWMEQGVDMPMIHASTQTDNRDADKVAWLARQGFQRVVLARELSIDEIAHIHRQVPQVELEAFVHGALCVSYSGACYASQYCFGRSANRGACAQFCRLKFSLVDADGMVVAPDKYLLSLKDMCRIDHIRELIEAGVTSLKIEGRLKDVDYVKNVVAAYSQRLNQVIGDHPDKYRRASLGKCQLSFQPDLHKSFNRGFTDYFLHGRTNDIAAMDSPKAIGQRVGRVKEIGNRWLSVAGLTNFANGDGLCFFDGQRQLVGFRVNRVEGNKLFPLQMPKGLRRGMELYRNFDKAFVSAIEKSNSSVRKMEVRFRLTRESDTLSLEMSMLETELRLSVSSSAELTKANKPQHDMMVAQLSKLGNTPFVADSVDVDEVDDMFIPSSTLAGMRREMCDLALKKLAQPMGPKHYEFPVSHDEKDADMPAKNVANRMAKAFYEHLGSHSIDPAMELGTEDMKRQRPTLIMECKHCLRFSLGHCVRRGGTTPKWREPLALMLPDGRRFPLVFNCAHCQMNVYAES